MASALIIRPVEAFDLAVLAALHDAAFTAPWDQRWSEQSFAGILAMPGVGAWIAVLESEPVGFALARIVLDEAELLLIGIHPECRRAGHGRQLLDHLLAALAEAGATRVFLEVAEDNAAATAFYRQAGFHPVGRRRGYYRAAAAADAIVLGRALASGAPAISQ
jgi:ribosomal-protein-alanine N-acetyltransferase